jgi:hypothetical protein
MASVSTGLLRRCRRQRKTTNQKIEKSPRTAAQLGLTCRVKHKGRFCGKPVIWFDYQLGQRCLSRGFVCDDHSISHPKSGFLSPC